MGSVHKPLAKVHKGVEKYVPGTKLLIKAVGRDTYDKMHPGGTWSTKEAAKMASVEAAAKEAGINAEVMRRRQMEDLAKLDQEENDRIKKLLVAGRNGARGYRGGPMFRARPSNAAGRSSATSAAPRAPAGGGSASPSAPAMRAGGTRGGLLYRGVQQ